jgi:hypothetical protein
VYRPTMKRLLVSALVATCLMGSLIVSGTATAGNLSPRLAKSSCAIMGLTVASLRPYFGTTSVKWAGYECGIISDKVEATIYLYPLSEKAAATAELGTWVHPTRLGGLGAGAELDKGDGEYGVKLTSGTHFVYIDGQAALSQGIIIQLAHIIYRALA